MIHADKKDVLALYDFLDAQKHLDLAGQLRVCIDYLAFQTADKSIEIQVEVLRLLTESMSEFSVVFPTVLAAVIAEETLKKAAEQKG